MQKTEKYYQQKIAEEIRRILDLEQNKEVAEKFSQTLDKIKPKSCEVKGGASSGEYLDFVLAFEKGGEHKPFDLFIENIPDAAFKYGVLFGLCAEDMQFNSKTYLSNETHDYLMFKIVKNNG